MPRPPDQSQTYNSYQIIHGTRQIGYGTNIATDIPQEAEEALVVGVEPRDRVVMGVLGRPPL